MGMKRKLMLAVLSAAILTGGGASGAGAPPDAKLVYRTAPNTRPLSLWCYWPQGHKPSDRRGAVLLFHGGSWRRGSPDALAPQARYFTTVGMVGCSAEYRLAEIDGTSLIDSTKDARSAMRWLKAHAPELGIDPARIVAGGGSAGGQLAAALATTQRVNSADDDMTIDPTPAALLLFNPALNFAYPGFLRGNLAGAPAAAGLSLSDLLVADPVANVGSSVPPCLIFHGTVDDVVPIGAVQAFAEATGGACEVIAYEGEKHSFFHRPPAFDDIMRRSRAFLEARGIVRP
mgnify:CR=1 FL=1